MSEMHRRFRIVRACCSALALALPVAAIAEDAKAPAAPPAAVSPAAEATTPKTVKPATKARIVIAPARTAPARVATAEAVVEVSEAVPKSVQETPTTHKQSAIIKINGDGKSARLDDFCLDKNGNVLALVTPTSGQGRGVGLLGGLLGGLVEETEAAPAGDKKAEDKTPTSEIRTYDAEGKLISTWPVGFMAEAINLAPGGSIVVGGNGKVARFDAAGKKVSEGESPQMEYIRKNTEEMRERAKEQLEADKEMYAQQVKVYEEQLKTLDAVKAEDQTPEQKQQKQLFAAQVKMMKTMSEQMSTRTVDQVLQQVTARALKTHSICASDKEVYIVCPAMAGYGFGVWRTTTDFAEPKEIIKSLSGCCGQMDVQCNSGVLFVSENSRHRVIRYDRDGKELGTFGKRDREGEGENFGGCCNPMNCCFNSSGNLYVAESNGVVKHFTPDGKYLGMVGVANVQPGCKNSAVAATTDDNRLFYIDVQKHEIIVLSKNK
jgi:hypothetical protein